MPRPTDPDPDRPRPFPIQRKRLGVIRFIRPDGEFGFIEAEDFRDDVFFHHTVWQSDKGQVPQEKMAVEFEIDDDHMRETDKLRAKIVRPTTRPLGKKLSGRDAPHLIIKHHPNARRKRPNWRK
ncbi:cold-shock protein [Crateriforma conspicua]|uniref:Cold shock protein CspG n=1 Tax=Crateriforma conspicua TaxID=2527996 RepID=A0A5C5YCC6_9PLAN|nr:cold shock domain-containing protein [Crateriforma conspicua]QDV65573.1 cold shock protein CspG [Crateriforma conspicua]TWT70972.1 cold shock protein CspG [Crateriforma conspicua]